MNTTSIHIKVEEDIKNQAQRVAEDLGLSLSGVIKALLKQFVRTKQLSVGTREEIPNQYFIKSLRKSEEDVKAGRVISFESGDDAIKYVSSLISHGKKHTKALH